MGTDSNTNEEESAPVSGVAAPTGGSEGKHTKGPWHAVNYAGYYAIQSSPFYTDNSDLLDENVCPEAAANAELIARAPKLQEFKNYVHKRLDDAGIEKEPNGEHSKYGCRIGDRLDIVLDRLTEVDDLLELVPQNEKLEGEMAALKALLREYVKEGHRDPWYKRVKAALGEKTDH